MTAKLVNSHDYITVRVEFSPASRVNLTLNRYGVKLTATQDLQHVAEGIMDAFERAHKGMKGRYADNGEFMTALCKASQGLTGHDELLAVLDKMVDKPKGVKATVHGKEVTITASEDLILKETAPPTKGSSKQLTQQELEAAFDLVKNKKDWKARIDRTIKVEDLDRVMQAIMHFTGTVAREYSHPDPTKVIVRAAGYRAGPCGDR